MSEWPVLYVFMLIAYVCGSIPFGKIIGRLKGVDIQKLGSGNIGFANSVRVLGWKPGVFVLIGDATKGFLPVYLSVSHIPYWQSLMVGLVAILAHVFPVWLRFKDGKGIAPGLGISLVLAPKIALF